jgi:hypothetical protein
MPYIGKTPLTGAYQLCDTITTSATATYNLTVGSSPVIPGAAQNCIVSLNGVIQAPVSAYTVSGSTITFASTLSATDVIDFILILGNVFDIGKPTDGSVTNASVASNAAIALSKLATTGTMTFASTIGVGGATPAASGAGITFPASQSASTDANTLDDYEEGTFIPTIIGTTAAGTFTPNASYTYGRYTKIGRIVHIYFGLVYSSFTGTGNIKCGGLPFTSQNEYTYLPIMTAGQGLTKPANTIILGILQQNTNQIEASTYSTSGTDSSVSALAVDSAAEIYFNFFYNV